MMLSERQKEALDKMEPGKWYSAYSLQVGLNTLWALERKGFLIYVMEIGSIAFPRNSIKWRLKGADDGTNTR